MCNLGAAREMPELVILCVRMYVCMYVCGECGDDVVEIQGVACMV